MKLKGQEICQIFFSSSSFESLPHKRLYISEDFSLEVDLLTLGPMDPLVGLYTAQPQGWLCQELGEGGETVAC